MVLKGKSFAFLKKERRSCVENWVQKKLIFRILTSHTVLAFCYGIFLFAFEMAFLRDTVSFIHPVLIGWAGALAVYDIVVRQLWEKLPLWQPLVLFAFLAGITALVNRQAGLVGNVKAWVMTVLPLVAFLPLCLLQKKEKREKVLLAALSGAAVLVFLASLVAVVLYLLRISVEVELWGITRLVGFRHHIPDDPESAVLLYGLYFDTNHAAAYAIVFAAYSLWLLNACRRGVFAGWKKLAVRIFAVANLVVQLCYFPLANSRGGWLSLGVTLIISAFLYLFCTRLKSWKFLGRLALSAGAAVLIMAILCSGLVLLRSGLSSLSYVLEYVPESAPSGSASTGPVTLQPVKPPTYTRPGQDSFVKTEQNLGSGRTIIWTEAMDVYAIYPVLGIGPDNSTHYARLHGIGQKLPAGSSLHNSFLDLLIDYGALGFLALMSFYIGCVWLVLCKFFKFGDQATEAAHISAFCVVFLAGASMLLSCLFVSTTAMYFILLCPMSFLVAQCSGKVQKAHAEE